MDKISKLKDELKIIQEWLDKYRKKVIEFEAREREINHQLKKLDIFLTVKHVVGCGKRIYPTEDVAKIQRKRINALMNAGYNKLKRAYFCKVCNGWHLTSQEDKFKDK